MIQVQYMCCSVNLNPYMKDTALDFGNSKSEFVIIENPDPKIQPHLTRLFHKPPLSHVHIYTYIRVLEVVNGLDQSCQQNECRAPVQCFFDLDVITKRKRCSTPTNKGRTAGGMAGRKFRDDAFLLDLFI